MKVRDRSAIGSQVVQEPEAGSQIVSIGYIGAVNCVGAIPPYDDPQTRGPAEWVSIIIVARVRGQDPGSARTPIPRWLERHVRGPHYYGDRWPMPCSATSSTFPRRRDRGPQGLDYVANRGGETR